MWRIAVGDCCGGLRGGLLWRIVVEDCCGGLLWTIVVEDCCVNELALQKSN